MRVLIVDDVPFLLMSLRQLLQRNGYDVVTASSAEMGLSILKGDFTIGAVISDLVMPEMNGMEFFKRARAIERLNDEGTVPPPPFILFTSFAEADSTSELAADFRLAKRTFAAVLHKPVVADELLTALQRIDKSGPVAGHDATIVEKILQSSLDKLAKASCGDEVTTVVEKLQLRLFEYLANISGE
jgi:CheY-like chemotaxis protein